MKKAITIILMLVCSFAMAQTSANYLRLGKKTTAELETIDRSNTSYIYTAYDTELGIEVIDFGSGWEPRFSSSSGELETGSFNAVLGGAGDTEYNANLTYANYYAIGELVFVNIRFSAINGFCNDYLRVKNLPFFSIGTNPISGIFMSGGDVPYYSIHSAVVGTTLYIYFQDGLDTDNFNNMSDVTFVNGSLIISGFYYRSV